MGEKIMALDETMQLIEELKSSKDLYAYLKKYDLKSTNISFVDYLNTLFHESNMKKSDIIRSMNMTRSYAYEIFSGSKNPSRDKTLMLSYGLSLDYEATQRLLTLGKHNPLHPKDKRDSIIIYTIYNKMNLISANMLLLECQEAILA
ncbi:hypothetical protein [Petrocella atlantisensis]|nr:hypothetical protein [Petrocella atlantisensis]